MDLTGKRVSAEGSCHCHRLEYSVTRERERRLLYDSLEWVIDYDAVYIDGHIQKECGCWYSSWMRVDNQSTDSDNNSE